MSSLRISHQNRGIAAPGAGGDTGRSESADAGASFAIALGAAARIAPKDTVALPEGKPSDDGGSSPGPRKRIEGQEQSNDAASIAASVAGAVVAAITGGDISGINTASTTSPVASGGALIASLAAGGVPPGLVQNIASKAADVGSPGIAAVVAPAAAVAGATISGPVTASFPTVASLPTRPIAPAPVAELSLGAMPSGAGTSSPQASLGGGDTAEGVMAAADGRAPHFVAPTQTPAPSVVPAAAAATGTPSAAMVAVAADTSGLAAPLAFALPIDPGPAATAGEVANIAATVSPGLPLPITGQLASPDGGGASGFALRDRFVPSASTADAGSVVAASASAAASNASAPTASSAAVAPGLTPDASSANTIAYQVAGQLARMVSNGSGEMVMRLHPPELGDLTVRVAVSGRDVAAWFASPQPQVQTAISAAIGQLQTNLGNAGYNLSGAWVGADASSARQQQNSSLPTAPALRAPLTAVTALPVATATVRSSSSGLNVYV